MPDNKIAQAEIQFRKRGKEAIEIVGFKNILNVTGIRDVLGVDTQKEYYDKGISIYALILFQETNVIHTVQMYNLLNEDWNPTHYIDVHVGDILSRSVFGQIVTNFKAAGERFTELHHRELLGEIQTIKI